MHPVVAKVTADLEARSATSRQRYLDNMRGAERDGVQREVLSCGNLVHGFAACAASEKEAIKNFRNPNLGIVTAYNDMLSAHQPYQPYPDKIKAALSRHGITAQVAGGVPAMCDGVTQGQPGMELSLFSRDQIALSTAIALSHNMFDAVAYLGICDKIVPGLMMAAVRFGHLPGIFIPAGPMPSGISNSEKQRVRKLYREGKVGKDALLEAESASYHSPGTCTFYGTANSNQMLMEMMGMQLPGSSFINPGTPLREKLTEHAALMIARLSALSVEFLPVYQVITEKSIINAVAGLLATGGSTNHTLHLVAIARCAGIDLSWDDIDRLSAVVPLLARVYPNGEADVNHFHQAGGMSQIVRQLLDREVVHDDVYTVAGPGLHRYTKVPQLDADGELEWVEGPQESSDSTIISLPGQPFSEEGGIRVLNGNLGRSVIKVSAVPKEDWIVEAPAKLFFDQSELEQAFNRDELNSDMVAVVLFEGPKAKGMPELHKLTPTLSILRDRGYKVALVTDGRMSGASGKIAAAIHVTPEAADAGPLARLRNGDIIRLDAESGTLEALVDAAEWANRSPLPHPAINHYGMGRELFSRMRDNVGRADQGACTFALEIDD